MFTRVHAFRAHVARGLPLQLLPQTMGMRVMARSVGPPHTSRTPIRMSAIGT
jgi:hypothetical protein